MVNTQINLTINDLIEHLNASAGRDISIERINEHGKKGDLSFVLTHPDGKRFKLIPLWENPENLYYYSDYIPLNNTMFKHIISSSTPKQVSILKMVVDGQEKEFTLDPYHHCTQSDLRIQMEEALRFGKEYFSANQTPTSKDLFTQPVVSELFDVVSATVDRFIEKNMRLPNGYDEVFNHLNREYGVKNQEATLPTGNISRDNFRRRYKSWVGSQGKTDHNRIKSGSE